ncbi:MAG: hypothetical protein GXP21_03350 [Gammaproteobacteria bacterium]|nr:hypothetical protein [Gammaproteobacteria bacterium]
MRPFNHYDAPIVVLGLDFAPGSGQVGALAARKLDNIGFTRRYPDNLIDIDICHSPDLLLERCSSAHALILLDAYFATEPVGLIKHFTIADLDATHQSASSHGFDIKQTLELCAAADIDPQQISIIGLCVGRDAYETTGQPITEVLDCAFQALVNAVDAEIKRYKLQLPDVTYSISA